MNYNNYVDFGCYLRNFHKTRVRFGVGTFPDPRFASGTCRRLLNLLFASALQARGLNHGLGDNTNLDRFTAFEAIVNGTIV